MRDVIDGVELLFWGTFRVDVAFRADQESNALVPKVPCPSDGPRASGERSKGTAVPRKGADGWGVRMRTMRPPGPGRPGSRDWGDP
jgi:hypothetical protein